MDVLVVESLSKSYGGKIVLSNINLSVGKGVSLVVLGGNGSGKTTLLNCIAGVLKPDTGIITIAGEIVFSSKSGINVPPESRGTGLVPQDYALFPHLDVYSNIALGLKARRWSLSEIDRRVKEVAEILGIKTLLSRYPQSLSGGEKQKVAIARAIAFEPKLLLLDEPLSAIDFRSRSTYRRELRRIISELGTTTLMVTHSFVDAWIVGDRIAVLRDGIIVAEADKSVIAENSAKLGVAEALGVQLFSGIVEEVEGEEIVVYLEKIGKIALSKSKKSNSCREGSRVVVAIREDDPVLVRDSRGKNIFQAVVEEVTLTRHGVRLQLVLNEAKLEVEAGRGYVYSVLGRLPDPGDRISLYFPGHILDYICY